MKKIKFYIICLIVTMAFFSISSKSYGQTSNGGTLLNNGDTVCYGNNYGMLRLNGEIGDAQYCCPMGR